MKLLELSPSRKIYYNVVSQVLLQIITAVVGFILPRFILTAYGSEYNGMVASITQFLSFVVILRLGVAGATRVALYQSLSKKDIIKTSGIILATESFMRRIAYAIIIYTVVLVMVYPYLIDSSYSWLEISSLIVAISIGIFFEYFLGITYETLLMAAQVAFVSVFLRVFLTITNAFIVVFMITSGFSIQAVKLFSSIVFALSPIFLYYFVPRWMGLVRNVPPNNSALKQRYDVMASSIANIIHENVDMIVLVLLTSPLVVSVYAVYSLVTNGLRQLMRVFTGSLEGYFGELWASNKIDEFSLGLSRYEFFVCFFVSVAYSCAFFLLLPFVRVYTAGVTDVDYIIPVYAFLALTAELIYCIRAPYLTVVQAAGRYKETKYGAYFEAGLNIFISLISTYLWGIIGVAIGTVCANMFRTIQYAIYISEEIISRNNFDILKKIIWMIGNVVTTLFLANIFINIEEISWLAWGRAAVENLLLSFFIAMVTTKIFYKNNYDWIVKSFIHRKLKM